MYYKLDIPLITGDKYLFQKANEKREAIFYEYNEEGMAIFKRCDVEKWLIVDPEKVLNIIKITKP